jgi:hypothetical protein
MCYLSRRYYSRRPLFEPLGLKRDFNFGEITAADIGRMNVTKEVRDKLRQKVPGYATWRSPRPIFIAVMFRRLMAQ